MIKLPKKKKYLINLKLFFLEFEYSYYNQYVSIAYILHINSLHKVYYFTYSYIVYKNVNLLKVAI